MGFPSGGQGGSLLDADDACLKDDETGLLWEVKSEEPDDPRYVGHTYSWYLEDPGPDDGDQGGRDNGTCPLPPCNTEKYVLLVNTMEICGCDDWRLPTLDELTNLARLDPDPNEGKVTGEDSFYWSSQSTAEPDAAWGFYSCCGGVPAAGKKDGAASVRLVCSP